MLLLLHSVVNATTGGERRLKPLPQTFPIFGFGGTRP
jgi:hypothetical protein